MSRNALGRGLGNLLSHRETVHRPSEGAVSKPAAVRDLGPGLRVLILKKGGIEAESEPHTSASSWGCSAVKISLVGGDIALAALVVLWQSASNTPIQPWEAAVCAGCILLAAWLGWLAAWLHFHSD